MATMKTQRVNSDIMINAILSGTITEDQYIQMSVATGDISEADARSNLDSLLEEVTEERVRLEMKSFKNDALSTLIEAATLVTLPQGLQAALVKIKLDAVNGVSVETFQVKKTDGERFISLRTRRKAAVAEAEEEPKPADKPSHKKEAAKSKAK